MTIENAADIASAYKRASDHVPPPDAVALHTDVHIAAEDKVAWVDVELVDLRTGMAVSVARHRSIPSKFDALMRLREGVRAWRDGAN